MTKDREKWAERIVRSPKSGRDYTSARVQENKVDQDQATRSSPMTRDTPDKRQNVDIRIDQLRASTNNLEERIKQFESLSLNERLVKTERRSLQLSILLIVVAALLALSILRDVLVETGVDVKSVFSTFHTSQPFEGNDVQPNPGSPDNENSDRSDDVGRIIR